MRYCSLDQKCWGFAIESVISTATVVCLWKTSYFLLKSEVVKRVLEAIPLCLVNFLCQLQQEICISQWLIAAAYRPHLTISWVKAGSVFTWLSSTMLGEKWIMKENVCCCIMIQLLKVLKYYCGNGERFSHFKTLESDSCCIPLLKLIHIYVYCAVPG